MKEGKEWKWTYLLSDGSLHVIWIVSLDDGIMTLHHTAIDDAVVCARSTDIACAFLNDDGKDDTGINFRLFRDLLDAIVNSLDFLRSVLADLEECCLF